MAEFETFGKTNNDGTFIMFSRPAMTRFFEGNPEKQFRVTISTVMHIPHPSVRKYYFMIVVRDFQLLLKSRGYKMNRQQTHGFIKQFSPVMQRIDWDDSEDRPINNYRSITDLNSAEFNEYIEDLKLYAAVEFHHYIEDLIPYETNDTTDKGTAVTA